MALDRVYDTLRRGTSYETRQWFKRQPWFTPVLKSVFGTAVYSESYYSDVERIERTSMPVIAHWIAANLCPSQAIDVGCGPGHLSRALQDAGVQMTAVDISDAAIRSTADKGIPVCRFDLTVPDAQLPSTPYDLAISCEVAEHLEEEYAGRFVDVLVGASSRVYLTAAEPVSGQGVGMFHFNEQPNEYWIRRFGDRGYKLESEVTAAARRDFAREEVVSYLAKPMIFSKN